MATFQEFYSTLDAEVTVRGKQFEKFCKWFLENDPYWKNEVDVVWHWEDYPDRWANKDLGVDLVFRDKDKNIWAVQAKCYDPDYYIKYEDMATFIAESNRAQIHKRLLISSTDNLGKNALSVLVGQDSKPVVRVMLSDLIKSNLIFPDNPRDLKKAKLLPKPEPIGKYVYQIEPINAVSNAFKTLDRGQLIMACGTGKTYTTLWVKEKLQAQSTLILLPSLSLLSQTLTEWNFAMNQDFRSLAVCSDDSVTKGAKEDDRTVESVSELPFPVTADPIEIASFLKGEGCKVIFSTYQSSPMIAEAMNDSSIPAFDLVIADEAHRCTGNMDSAFATVLDDSKIRTKKKLFATATPRTYSSNLKQAAEDREIKITGMDDEAVYGPVIYRLSFGEAIERGLLTDYQLVIIGVDDAMIADFINKRELISIEEEKLTDAKSLAAMIGLLKALKDYDLKRVISFHSRVSKARNFSEEILDVIKLLSDKDLPTGTLETDYVSGQMPTGQRRQKLQQLKELTLGDRMILSNARCLSEGVDVPALDGVAIIDPRQSSVDIVQTVGRAIRLSKDKTVGTIVMPVFLEAGEDAQNVIENSNFKPIWDVVNALKSHDDSLSFELDAYRTGLGKDKKTSRHVTGLDKIIIDLPKQYDTSFTESLKTILVEAVTENWLFWYGVLQKYKDEFGDCLVSDDFVTNNGFKLGKWVSNQRQSFIGRRKELSDEKIRKLEEIEFVWSPIDLIWNKNFNALMEYKYQFGNCSPPSNYVTPDGEKLGSWVNKQRNSYKDNELSTDKVAKLKEIGFVWNALDELWTKGFKELINYKNSFGNLLPVIDYVSPNGFKLGSWVSNQRAKYKKNSLSPERIEHLEAIGFIWNPHDASWKEGFEHLKMYKASHLDCSPSSSYIAPDGYKLGKWVNYQRTSYRKKNLSSENITQLEAIGFEWDIVDSGWNELVAELIIYKNSYGNCAPTTSYISPKGYKLGAWVSRVRQSHKLGRLSSEKIKMLIDVGLDFSSNFTEDLFKKGLIQLEAYLIEYGNSSPQASYISSDGFKLGRWVDTKRQEYKKGKLTQERIKLLESLGFVWKLK